MCPKVRSERAWNREDDNGQRGTGRVDGAKRRGGAAGHDVRVALRRRELVKKRAWKCFWQPSASLPVRVLIKLHYLNRCDFFKIATILSGSRK